MAQTQNAQTLSEMTPKKALDILKAGNKRFLAKQMEERDLLEQVAQTSQGQHPFAVILGCIDSRVPPELVFDLGIGDVFSVRIAGNFVNEDILGSMEFACKVVGSKLILVLGHTSCGAIKGAYDRVELGNLTGLVGKLIPAVEKTTQEKGSEQLDLIAETNVELNIEEIKRRSPILNELVQQGEIEIVGAMYDLSSGKVTFL